MISARTTYLLLISMATAACSTVGVLTEDRAWAVVEPSIAHQMMLDTPDITIFDLRTADEHLGDLGRIDGAISMPFDTLTERINELRGYRDKTILVYGDVESDVIEGIEGLVEAGCRNIVLIDGGIRNWIELGYKTVSSP